MKSTNATQPKTRPCEAMAETTGARCTRTRTAWVPVVRGGSARASLRRGRLCLCRQHRAAAARSAVRSARDDHWWRLDSVAAEPDVKTLGLLLARLARIPGAPRLAPGWQIDFNMGAWWSQPEGGKETSVREHVLLSEALERAGQPVYAAAVRWVENLVARSSGGTG